MKLQIYIYTHTLNQEPVLCNVDINELNNPRYFVVKYGIISRIGLFYLFIYLFIFLQFLSEVRGKRFFAQI